MSAQIPPVGEARDDYAAGGILQLLAEDGGGALEACSRRDKAAKTDA
ncbi:hypothetical protein R1N23_26985 [Klebsiella sp. 77381]